MNKNELKQFLLGTLENAKEASGGKQIICRCKLPGCNDTKQHLYIGDFESDQPIFYNCFKCHQSGFLGQNFFDNYNDFNVDSNLLEDAIKSNKGSSYKTYNKNKNLLYKIQNNYVTDSDLSQAKLKYINQRLGLQLSYSDLLQLKIVLNLNDLLQSNHITNLTRYPNIVDQLSNNFIGFLSRSNGSLNMRNLTPGKVHQSIDRKYINYNIFNEKADNDFYIIPTSIDINNHVQLHIAEGAFDILSVYFNVIENTNNCIFIAGKGKAYFNTLEYMITNFGLYDMEVHYYVDKDVNDYSIFEIVELMKPFMIDFYIHRNAYNDEKDYGVPKNRIVDSFRKV